MLGLALPDDAPVELLELGRQHLELSRIVALRKHGLQQRLRFAAARRLDMADAQASLACS
jgi:hypothetical protein